MLFMASFVELPARVADLRFSFHPQANRTLFILKPRNTVTSET